jgi:hypothetical protein
MNLVAHCRQSHWMHARDIAIGTIGHLLLGSTTVPEAGDAGRRGFAPFSRERVRKDRHLVKRSGPETR